MDELSAGELRQLEGVLYGALKRTLRFRSVPFRCEHKAGSSNFGLYVSGG
jgi:hypothetical protein